MSKEIKPPVFTHEPAGESDETTVRAPRYREKDKGVTVLLNKAQVAISNALTVAEISERLRGFGYDSERLMSGLFLYESLLAAFATRQDVLGARAAGNLHLHEARGAANRLYIKTLQLARMAFAKDPGARDALVLRGRRKQSLSGWLEQVLNFYDNILSRANFVQALAELGHDRERLEGEREAVLRVQKISAAQELKQGDARTASENMRAARKRLSSWMSNYRRVVKLALGDKPAWAFEAGDEVRVVHLKEC